MNPSPNSPRPFNPPPRLVDTRLPLPGFVPATLTRGVPVTEDAMGAIERAWAPDRARLAEELRAHGEVIEHAHWDWRNKAARQPGSYCLVTVECDGRLQGAMVVENLLRRSLLTPSAWLLYLDYVEIAPWNMRVPLDRIKPVAREALFSRVGRLLLGEAIRMSFGATAGGRVGLHSLQQSEDFYAHCGMTRIGPDPNYYDLVYFEYADGVAATQLTALELSV